MRHAVVVRPLALCGLGLLALLLVGCQDQQARAETARLTARLAALEAEVRELKQSQESPQQAATVPDTFMVRASAQNCANDLSRTLETFRDNSVDGLYPTPAQLTLPDSCLGQRIGWTKLTGQAYAFVLKDEDGAVLAQSQSQSQGQAPQQEQAP